jgi:hypothetical protein
VSRILSYVNLALDSWTIAIGIVLMSTGPELRTQLIGAGFFLLAAMAFPADLRDAITSQRPARPGNSVSRGCASMCRQCGQPWSASPCSFGHAQAGGHLSG